MKNAPRLHFFTSEPRKSSPEVEEGSLKRCWLIGSVWIEIDDAEVARMFSSDRMPGSLEGELL